MTDKPSVDRKAWAVRIGELEAQISTLEGQLREAERDLAGVTRNRTGGAAALLIGILGLLFFSPGYLGLLWLFLCLIGALTLITAIVKQGGAKQRISDIQSSMTASRAQLAEGRVLLL